MLENEKILITGATGKIAFPIARALAQRNEVWGAARFSKPGDRDRLAAAGVRPLRLDMSSGDFSAVPDDFTYVFHAAVDPGARRLAPLRADQRRQLRRAAASLPQGEGVRLLLDRVDLPVPGASTADRGRWAGRSRSSELQLLEDRRRSRLHLGRRALRGPAHHHPHLLDLRPAGRRTGRSARADVAGKADPLHPDKPNNYNPIYEDDYVDLGIRAMEVAAVPPVVVNWAGSETVSAEDYCAYLGELVGVEPIFEYTPEAHTPLWPDVTYMHEILGRTKVHWRDGFRRMIEARHPELLRAGKDAAK